jgi:hypothetical protein
MKSTIVIICHRNDRRTDPRGMVIHHLAELWREDGHDVRFLFGVRDFVPADLAILHVDLSVVPGAYLKLTQRYPVVVNGRVTDIRKSVISRSLVTVDDPYEGPVIVKSDLNFAGEPERRLRRFPRLMRSVDEYLRPHRLREPAEYPVYGSLGEVPQRYLRDPGLVVEKFLPEIEGDLYCVRLYEFLGDRWTCVKLLGRHPIVNGATCIRVETVEPHPGIVARRKELGFDYGKFDYVIRDGEAILLDANKTTGTSPTGVPSPENLARRRHRAQGIYFYLRS